MVAPAVSALEAVAVTVPVAVAMGDAVHPLVAAAVVAAQVATGASVVLCNVCSLWLFWRLLQYLLWKSLQ